MKQKKKKKSVVGVDTAQMNPRRAVLLWGSFGNDTTTKII